MEVFKEFSLDKFLQLLAEQIIEDDSSLWTGFNSASWSRTSRRPASVSLDHLAHTVLTFNLGIISACDSLRRLLEEFLAVFDVMVDTDPEVNTRRLHLELWNYFYEPLVSCPGSIELAFST